MADYKQMYQTLCAGVSEVLDDMPDMGPFKPYYDRLEALLQQAEDIYIDTENVVSLEDSRKK